MRSPENETTGNACDTPAAEQIVQSETSASEPVGQAGAEASKPEAPEAKSGPKLVEEFLAMKFAPRSALLGPIIMRRSINMLYAWRGIGKTMLALNIAGAVASGGEFHKWKAPKPATVLYLDGEMTAEEMQGRLKAMLASGSYPGAEKRIYLLNPDAYPKTMPNLSTPEGQVLVLEMVSELKIDLLVVDNISTLTSGYEENKADSWVPLQDFALKVKRMGAALLFVHHASKNGGQRGTSKKEDVMDTVIQLTHPDDYEPSQGARFKVGYDKGRYLRGEDSEGFEAQLNLAGTWDFKSLDDERAEVVWEMMDEGYSLRKIAKALGISKSTVQRLSKLKPASTTT